MGQGAETMSFSLGGAIPAYRQASDPKVEARALERLAKDPQIQRKLAAFEVAVGKHGSQSAF